MVKPADKGGITVVWGKTQYINEALRQLCDPQYYFPLMSNLTIMMRNELKVMLNTALENEWITDQEHDFPPPDNPKLATFYLLPKIHKNLNSPQVDLL